MPIIKYFCRYCDAAFETRADALTCERSHLKAKKARSLCYVRGPFPLTVEVEFADGSKIVYIQEEAYWQK